MAFTLRGRPDERQIGMDEQDNQLAAILTAVARVEAKIDALIEALAVEEVEEAPRQSLDGDTLDLDRDPLSPL